MEAMRVAEILLTIWIATVFPLLLLLVLPPLPQPLRWLRQQLLLLPQRLQRILTRMQHRTRT